MSARGKHSPLSWLRGKGPLIDKDAAVSSCETSGGHSVTFNLTYDGKRSVRLTFSNVSAAERKDLMMAWLNGELPGLKP